MAKLSARGRQEVFRVERERDVVPAPPSTTIWRKDVIVLMSDGTTLEKMQVKFAPNPNLGETSPKLHDWGWKKRGKLGAKADPKQLLEAYAKRGYTVVSAPGVSGFDASYFRALAASAPK